MGKIKTVTLPDIGEGVIEGEVVSWLKQINDDVAQDEPVVVVMTDKATVELPSPYPGKLVKQHYQVGEKAIKDQPLYDILLAGEEHVPPEPMSEKKAEKLSEEPVRPLEGESKVLATPKIRQLAKEMGVDIHDVQGTGPEGHVTMEDLKRVHQGQWSEGIPSPFIHLPGDEERQLTGIPLMMAEKMARSKEKIPHFSFFERVDATRLVLLRQQLKKEAGKRGVFLTFMPFLIRGLSMTIKQYPLVNSSFDASTGHVITHKVHNVGIAMSTKLGLIVPVLKNVQEMSLMEIVDAFEELKNRASSGELKAHEMKESTITISNFGIFGGEGLWATPIINYPEAAILAVARIRKQPTAKGNQVEVREILNLSWSFDHRLIDGNLAAHVSHHFATLIQNPDVLV